MMILKILAILITVFWTIINTGRLIMKNDVPLGNIVLQTIGITSLIILFLMY